MRPDLFPGTKPPRAKPRVLMHAVDHGYDGNLVLGFMECSACGRDPVWWNFTSHSELNRGVPCPECNPDSPQGASDA